MIRMVYSNDDQRGDLSRPDGTNFETGLDLETAVLISWFTERRLEPGDDGAESLDYSGGWWGDSYGVEGDRWGSRFWRLARQKATQDNISNAKIWAEEALAWMIEDGVTPAITVETERGVTPNDLLIKVEIERPSAGGKWEAQWELQLDAL
jgi:phage gp46-like protein